MLLDFLFLLEFFIAQQKQQRNNGKHIAHDTNGQDLSDGHTQPNTHRNGTSQFDNGHGRNGGQDGPLWKSKLHEKSGNFLSGMQVFDWGDSSDRFGKRRRLEKGQGAKSDRRACNHGFGSFGNMLLVVMTLEGISERQVQLGRGCQWNRLSRGELVNLASSIEERGGNSNVQIVIFGEQISLHFE
jgi:hypothetical protein